MFLQHQSVTFNDSLWVWVMVVMGVGGGGLTCVAVQSR